MVDPNAGTDILVVSLDNIFFIFIFILFGFILSFIALVLEFLNNCFNHLSNDYFLFKLLIQILSVKYFVKQNYKINT